jgi:hypothetical protein
MSDRGGIVCPGRFVTQRRHDGKWYAAHVFGEGANKVELDRWLQENGQSLKAAAMPSIAKFSKWDASSGQVIWGVGAFSNRSPQLSAWAGALQPTSIARLATSLAAAIEALHLSGLSAGVLAPSRIFASATMEQVVLV